MAFKCPCASWCVLVAMILACTSAAQASAMNQSSLTSGLGLFSKKACKHAKPTLFLMSGIGGTEMRGTFKGNNSYCSEDVKSTEVWFDEKWFVIRKLACWGYMMSMEYDEHIQRWHNSTGTELWPDDSQFDASSRSKQKLYYRVFMKHVVEKHGYIYKKDFFSLPFDWRIGIKGLVQQGILSQLADRVAAGVKANCGQKAIIVSHSFGANIMAHMLHMPEFKAWREQNVKGWVPVGGPFGGTAATAWLSQLSGDFFKLFPLASNLLPVETAHKFPLTIVGRSVYHFAFGLPTWTFMTPRDTVWPKDHVIVSTPTKNYTIADQKQLMLDMGNTGGASILDESLAINDAAMAAGPVPGVETYCLYGTAVPTSSALVFNNSIPYRAVSKRPMAVEWTDGDGVVDLKSLRLCSKFAPQDNVKEVNGPLVDHVTILAHPLGLEALSSILNKLGVPTKGSKLSIGGVLNISLNVTQGH